MNHAMSELFERMRQFKVLVLGDVMIDRYVLGHVSRVSPEAPVPVVHFQKEENRLGGAANVALNIAAMGATPLLVSLIGHDAYGTQFLHLLPQASIAPHGIVSSHHRRTTVKTRVIAQGQHLLRIDREDTHPLNQEEEAHILAHLQQLLKAESPDVLILQDYNKGLLTPKVIEQTIQWCRARQIPTAVDPKRHNFFAFRQTTLFKPNLKEVSDALGWAVQPTLTDLAQASQQLRQQLDHHITLITLSEKGIFFDDGKEMGILPAHPRDIADVCGAGDTVISIATLALAAGLSVSQIALLANLAGGQVCERVGVVPVEAQRLMHEWTQAFAPQRTS